MRPCPVRGVDSVDEEAGASDLVGGREMEPLGQGLNPLADETATPPRLPNWFDDNSKTHCRTDTFCNMILQRISLGATRSARVLQNRRFLK